jgi:hypothetical protein
MTRTRWRVPLWLPASGWLIGAIAFVRLTQILPCCQPVSIEASLSQNICGHMLVTDCPRYETGVPR